VARGRDERPQYRRIAAHLRAQIMTGELPPGAQLPSTQHLMDRYGAANTTVQRALAALKTEGFLTSRVGKGVYVRDRQPLVVRVGPYFQPSPRGYSYQILNVTEVQPPADVALALNLDDNGTALVRHRLMLHDGDPVELSWSYYPIEIAAGSPLAGRAKIRGGAPQALADLGYRQSYFTDQVSARLPTTEEFEGLGLPDDVPVMRQFRVIYSDTDRPVEVSILVKGAHLYELMYRETVT
jgi:GntR family transcriptional regulator